MVKCTCTIKTSSGRVTVHCSCNWNHFRQSGKGPDYTRPIRIRIFKTRGKWKNTASKNTAYHNAYRCRIYRLIIEWTVWNWGWMDEEEGVEVRVRTMISYKQIYKTVEIRTIALAWNSNSSTTDTNGLNFLGQKLISCRLEITSTYIANLTINIM